MNFNVAQKPFQLKRSLIKNLSEIRQFFSEHKTHLVILVVVGVFLGWMSSEIIRSPLDAPKEIVIKEGEGAYAIADILKNKGVIENKFVFIAYTFEIGRASCRERV